MTTGRINQVCHVLLRHVQPQAYDHGSARPSSKSAKVHISHQRRLQDEAPPSKRNLQLDTSEPHLSTVRKTALRCKPQVHTQRAVCHQAVAQYPESFNDHKETHRRLPLGSAVNAYAFSVDHWLLDTSTRSYRANKTLGGPVPLPPC